MLDIFIRRNSNLQQEQKNIKFKEFLISALPYTTYHFQDLSLLLEHYNLSAKQFSQKTGFKLKTIQGWRNGEPIPKKIKDNILKVIEERETGDQLLCAARTIGIEKETGKDFIYDYEKGKYEKLSKNLSKQFFDKEKIKPKYTGFINK